MKGNIMPRLHAIDPATETGPGADLLNGPLKQKQINIFKGLANNPGVLKAFLAFKTGINTGALTDREHEVIALVTAAKRDCEYCSAAHTIVAQGVGIDEEQALAIRRGQVDDPKMQTLIDFTSAVLDTNGYVSDEQLESFRSAGHDDAAVIEVLAELALNRFTNLFNHVNETVIDFPVPLVV